MPAHRRRRSRQNPVPIEPPGTISTHPFSHQDRFLDHPPRKKKKKKKKKNGVFFASTKSRSLFFVFFRSAFFAARPCPRSSFLPSPHSPCRVHPVHRVLSTPPPQNPGSRHDPRTPPGGFQPGRPSERCDVLIDIASTRKAPVSLCKPKIFGNGKEQTNPQDLANKWGKTGIEKKKRSATSIRTSFYLLVVQKKNIRRTWAEHCRTSTDEAVDACYANQTLKDIQYVLYVHTPQKHKPSHLS